MSRSGDPFTGIRLKRQRAWDEINSLKADIRAFVESDPYEPRIKFDGKTHWLTVSVHTKKGPDSMWGVRIGEIVHNLRSALDHVVWQLFIKANKRTPRLPSKLQFPIVETKAGFDARAVPIQLNGIAQNAIALIRSEQPFPVSEGGTGEGPKSPLWHLAELSNADKHRTLHVTGTTLTSYSVNLTLTRDVSGVQRHQKCGPGPIQEDTVLERAYFPGVTEWPFKERQVEGQLGVDVAFDLATPALGGWIVISTLIDIANRTDRILHRLGIDIFRIEL